jgi:hypothetical protein
VSIPVNTNNAVPSRNSLIVCLFITIILRHPSPSDRVESIKNASHSGSENHDFFLEAIGLRSENFAEDGKKYRSVLSDLPARVSAHI